MPRYDFKHKETGKVKEYSLKISEYDDFVENNPQLQRIYTPIAHTIEGSAGSSILSRAGDGWKEVQQKIKNGLPPGLKDNIKTK